MSEDNTSLAEAGTYDEMVEYFETHDLGEMWEQTRPAEFNTKNATFSYYFRIEKSLAQRIYEVAKQHGVSSETLLNLWVQEKLAQEPAPPPRRAREKAAAPPVETAEPTAKPEGEGEPVAATAEA